MRNLSKYKVTGLFVILLGLISCGEYMSETSEHKEKSPEMGISHSENEAEEVMLTARQFDVLQMSVDTLHLRNMSGYVEANGQLEVPPQNEATITAVVGANVVSIEVIEGDKVNKGQTVAYLSHPNIIQKQTDYLNAYSNSRFLKKEFERQKTLYEAGVGSGANYQKADAEYESSRNRANGLEAQLQQLNVNASGVRKGTIYQRVALRSPIDGFIQKVEVKTGQYVEPQTDLMEVVDTHHVHADLMVFEKDVYRVKKGQTVTFSVQSNQSQEMSAIIYSVGKTFEESPKALHVHAEIDKKQGPLIPGMYIQGRIQTENVSRRAIPESAIASEGSRSFVFRAEMEGKEWHFTPVEIKKSIHDGEWIAIDFLKDLDPTAQYAQNNAYYLMAEMKKGDAEHSH